MYLLVAADTRPALHGTDDFKSFEVRLAPGALRSLLASALAGIGEVEGDHAWIREGWLADALARKPPVPDWRAGFDAMTRYAHRQGWLRENPRAIRAHITGA